MNEVLHANIFFFITGIAVITFTLLLSIALYHCIKALKSLRRIIDRIDAGTEIIAEDLGYIRDYFSEGGFVGRLISLLTGNKSARRSRDKNGKQGKKRLDLSSDD